MRSMVFMVLMFLSGAAICEDEAKEKRSVKELLEIGEVIGLVGAATVDATVGEIFVRAYPKRIILEQPLKNNGHIELSCDTFRTGAANHYVAVADKCHIEFTVKARKGKYTLTGPFTQEAVFDDRSCAEARSVCSDYSAAIIENNGIVNILSAEKVLGTLDFSGLTPTYTLSSN